MHSQSIRDEVVALTKSTGVLPAIKLKTQVDLLPYAQALLEGGARVIEITMTTPGATDAFQAISREFGQRIHLAAGTVLSPAAALAALHAGARALVTPVVEPEVIEVARTYGAACFSGAFTATECLAAMRAGADMVKIFPAALAGPEYVTNLRMVFPEISLIPSGGISLETAAEYIQCGACAISGARNFVNQQAIEQYGFNWITEQTTRYIGIVSAARNQTRPLS